MHIRKYLQEVATFGLPRALRRYKEQAALTVIREEPSSSFTTEDLLLLDINMDANTLNTAISNSEQPFIAFYDTDANFDADYFTAILAAFTDPDVGACSGLIRNHAGKPISRMSKPNEVGLRLNTDLIPSYAILLPYGTIYRREVIESASAMFDDRLKYCRNEVFAAQCAEQYHTVARLNAHTYQTALVLDESSLSTPQSLDRDWYFESTLPLLNALKREKQLSAAAQYCIYYLTMQRFKSNEGNNIKMVFINDEDRDLYLSQVRQTLDYVSSDIFFSRTSTLKLARQKKIYLANLRSKPTKLIVRANSKDAYVFPDERGSSSIACRLTEQRLNIKVLRETVNDHGQRALEFIFHIANCFPESSHRIFVESKEDGVVKTYDVERITQLAATTTFFDIDANSSITYRVIIPLSDANTQELKFAFAFGKHIVSPKMVFSEVWQNKLSTDFPDAYWYFDGYIARSYKSKIVISPAGPEERKEAEERYLRKLEEKLCSMNQSTPQYQVLSKAIHWRKLYWDTYEEYKDRRIWTYNDKGYKAGDNGEYAIRYAHMQNDGIEKVFYIDASCPDGIRLANAGFHVLDPGTDEAILYAMHAEVIFMTHVPPYHKMGIKKGHLMYLKDLLQGHVIRMYHGFPITKSPSYSQIDCDADGVVVTSEYERALYTNEDHCYRPDQIIACGNPRYDDLVDQSQRQILFAPTWRPSLVGRTLVDGSSLHNDKFKESNYYKLYNEILNSPRLLEAAKRNNYSIKMFLHPKLSAQTIDFESNEIVQSLSCTEDIDYVTIMTQSDLMITDFSSVQYDFAYMRKPVVYYHDPALPYWRITNFDYESIGFGEICQSAKELVDVLVYYMDHNCTLKPEYRDRIDSFFLHDDRLSAKRLYDSTREMFG